jgi:hypothetical protein
VTAPLTFLETADLLGRYRHVELSLFARLGERAPTCGDAALVVYLAGASRAHGYRAGLVESLLPVSDALPAVTGVTRSPGGRLEEALDVLTADGHDDDLLDALVGAVYPAMTAAYAEHLAQAGSPADAAVQRVLRRVLADLGGITTDSRALGPATGASARAGRVRELLQEVPGAFGSLRRDP